MKLKFIKVFLVSFFLIFAVLNGRFLYANAKYWLDNGVAPVSDQSPAPQKLTNEAPLPDKAMLVIEKIGVSAPVVFGVSNDNDTIFKNLENGIVYYSNTPKPGLKGVSIILGHSSAYPWYKGKYGSVFALLGKLQLGDKFSVRYDDGRTFNFVVKQSVVFSPFADDSRLTQIEKSPGTSLVLVSCWPVGTNYKRIAVQAELI
ncbi:MAG: sortase [Candidatus Yanofskybacteria bacterium]|nr:sortase [Candidatus Yanofskybacteria bacterium]